MSTPTVRVGLNLSVEAAEALDYLADKWGISKTQVINKVLVEAEAGN